MITSTFTRYFSVAFVSLALTSGALFANEQERQSEDAFRQSHIYRTQLKDTDVSMSVDHGVAVLKGTVQNDEQRSLAEDTARGLPGIERVDNRIRVTNEPKESSDDWVSMKVKSALLFHRNVSATDTHIQVHNGVVVLTGTARSDAEKALTEEYAKDVKGVRSVDNQMTVVSDRDRASVTRRDEDARSGGSRTIGEHIDDASITAQVKSSLAVHSSTSAVHTNVTTRDGIVTVTGEARNGAEKDLVTKLAENIDGVRGVHNDITIADR